MITSERERRFDKSEVLSGFINDISKSRNTGKKIEKGGGTWFFFSGGPIIREFFLVLLYCWKLYIISIFTIFKWIRSYRRKYSFWMYIILSWRLGCFAYDLKQLIKRNIFIIITHYCNRWNEVFSAMYWISLLLYYIEF